MVLIQVVLGIEFLLIGLSKFADRHYAGVEPHGRLTQVGWMRGATSPDS